MKPLSFVLVIAAVALFGTATVPDTTSPLDLKVVVAPQKGSYQLLKRTTPSDYTCSATLSQGDMGRPAIKADFVSMPGAKQSVTRRGGDLEMTFSVTIAQQGDRADTNVTVTRGGKLVMRQSSTIHLLNVPGKPYTPLQ